MALFPSDFLFFFLFFSFIFINWRLITLQHFPVIFILWNNQRFLDLEGMLEMI